MGIRRLLKRFITWIVHADDDEPIRADEPSNKYQTKVGLSIGRIHPTQTIENLHGMNFTVFSASGGKIIQVHRYDPRTDRTDSSLYVVTEEQNLGEELDQIITREFLTR